MLSGQNLHLSRLFRVALLCSLPAIVAQASAQLAPITQPKAADLFPHVGAKAELLTVLDMRKDSDADRLLAQSAQGLMNSEPQRTDKIYLILNDQDETWLNFLIKRQYVLSAGYMHDMEELIRRYPSRDAVLCDGRSTDAAATVGGIERLLVVPDPNLARRMHLIIKMDLRGKWDSASSEASWLIDHYGKKMNVNVVATAGSSNLTDYVVANKVFTLPLELTGNTLATRFNANIPCIGTLDDRATGITELSKAGKFFVDTSHLSNLSLWTTFPNPRLNEINSGAVAQPRASDSDDILGHHRSPDPDSWVTEWTADNQSKLERMAELRGLASPLFDARPEVSVTDEERNSFLVGEIDKDQYGADFGGNRDRVWTDYKRLSQDIMDLMFRF
jgi:hypothetical protein